MIEAVKTIEGSRADLAAIEVNPPTGFIGSLVYPVAKVAGKAGTYYYATLTADAAAQTNRTAGTAASATTLSESSSSFSAAERIKRYKVPYEMVPLVGGVAGSDKLGGKAAKRSVMRSLEQAQLTALVDGAGTTVSSNYVDAIVDAAEQVKLYSGKTVLVMSTGNYRKLILTDEIKNLLLRSFAGLPASSVLSIDRDCVRAALRGLFAIDDILIGDWSLWPQAYYTTVAVCKIPDGTDAQSFVMEPELGRTMVYWPEGATSEFEVNSFPDDDVRGNIYDACVWDSIEQFNSGAKVLLNIGSQATTTTTT
jgi:hypothetical protein